MNRSRIGRRRRGIQWIVAAGVTGIAIASLIANWAALGGRAKGARLRRMQKSPEWQGSHFENPQPIVNDTWAAIVSLFPNVTPHAPPRFVAVEPARFASLPPSGLRVTWLGHSTILLEIDGHRFLIDPVWSERVGPTTFAGPKRWFPPLLALRDLPPLDAVLLCSTAWTRSSPAPPTTRPSCRRSMRCSSRTTITIISTTRRSSRSKITISPSSLRSE